MREKTINIKLYSILKLIYLSISIHNDVLKNKIWRKGEKKRKQDI